MAATQISQLTWGDMQEAFRRMELTGGKVQWLPPALVGTQTDVRHQHGSRKQRRPLQPMQATPSSFNSSGSVYHRPVSLVDDTTWPCCSSVMWRVNVVR
jgi:hypothetical protein